MTARPRVFLDASALVSAVLSGTGAARLILKLGEAGVLSFWIGPWVLSEVEALLDRKSPGSKGLFALLLDRSGIQIAADPDAVKLKQARSAIEYLPDAQVVAEALTVGAAYFVSFDRMHLVGNPKAGGLPFQMGTAGDFLSWYRHRLAQQTE